jgi:hypothetical protein
MSCPVRKEKRRKATILFPGWSGIADLLPSHHGSPYSRGAGLNLALPCTESIPDPVHVVFLAIPVRQVEEHWPICDPRPGTSLESPVALVILLAALEHLWRLARIWGT